MILIFLIFFLICDAELDFYRLDVRKANTFLNNRSKRHNSRRGEEGSMFNHDDTLERECKYYTLHTISCIRVIFFNFDLLNSICLLFEQCR